MGCNCKQVKKIKKTIPSLVSNEYEKKGINAFLKLIYKYLWHLFGCIITVIFTIIAIPIVAIMAMTSYIKHGEMIISLPFLKRKK